MVCCFELGLVSIVVGNGFSEFAFNSSFNRGEDLFKFLSLNSERFGMVSYAFDQKEHITLLKIKYSEELILNGGYFVGFVKSFSAFK